MMDVIDLIKRYYTEGSKLYSTYIIHAHQVELKALSIANANPKLNVDTVFLSNAALLHDLGMFLTNAPEIHCFGTLDYIEHGVRGADLLRMHGYDRYALVAERHTGMGLTKEYIMERNLPLPHRDMVPISIEEQIICYADKFFSKSDLTRELSIEEIRIKGGKFGDEWVDKFDMLTDKFNCNASNI